MGHTSRLKWQDLFDFLKERGCHGDFRYTIEFFKNHNVSAEIIVKVMSTTGTCCCDCELLSQLSGYVEGEVLLGE